MPKLLAIFAAVVGIAFWRRKKLKDDARRVSDAARSRVGRDGSDKKETADDDSDATPTDDDSDATPTDDNSDATSTDDDSDITSADDSEATPADDDSDISDKATKSG